MNRSVSLKSIPPLIAVLLVLICSTVARATFTSAWTSTGQTDNTNGAAWADYDGDGDPDLLVANSGGANRLYRNDGGALILVWSSVATASSADAAWGDYDGDGDPDQLIANNGTTNRIYRNNGDDTFDLVWQSPDLAQTYSAAWADYDRDGDLDFAAGNNGANQVFRNDGGGAFNLVWTSTETDSTRAVAWADCDGDGDPDLLAASYGTSRVYRNDGGGAFTTAWSAPQVDTTLDAAWGDYDGDGDSDLVFGNTGAKANRVYRNDGACSFSLAWYAPTAGYTYSVAWGDYDGDGDLDMLAGDFMGRANRVYRNDGGGTFTLAWTSTETEETYTVAWADYDGDGDLDVFAGNNAAENRIYRNDFNPGNSAPAAPALTAEPDGEPGLVQLQWSAPADDNTPSALLGYQLRIGTCSGCGDVVSGVFSRWPGNVGQTTSFSSYLSVNTYYWSVAAVDTTGFATSAWAAEDSFILSAQAYESYWTGAGTPAGRAAASADYDGDGYADLLIGNSGSASAVYKNTGAGSFSQVWSSAQIDAAEAVAWADYDNDGDADLLIGNNGAANRVYRNDGGGAFTLVWSSTETDATTAAAWVDYDNDGDTDLLIGNNGAANRVYRNDGSGAFTLVWSSTETDATTAVARADYDNDGDADLLIGNNGAANRVYRNDGGGVFTLVWSSTETDATTAAVWADYDGDGDMDQLIGNNGAANRVYRNDGGVFTPVWSSTETDATRAVAVFDYDGDGDMDIMDGNNGAANRVYRNDGAGVFTLEWSSTEAEATYALAVADYDGDGDMDAAFANNGAAPRAYLNKYNPLNNAPLTPSITAEPDANPGVFQLQWTAPFDDNTPTALLGYHVRMGTLPGGDDVVSSMVTGYPGNAGAATSYSINLTTPGVYYWAVAAVDTTGARVSSYSSEDYFIVNGADTVPPLFDGVASTSGCGSGCMELSWQAATDVHGSTPITYNIYRATTSGGQNFTTPVATTTDTSKQVTGQLDDTTYYFVVRAEDSLGNEDTNTVEVSGMSALAPTLTKYSNNPVLTGDGDGFDAEGVLGPTVSYDGTLFTMWFSGRNGGENRLGYAVSLDGVNWARVENAGQAGVVLAPNTDPTAFDSKIADGGAIMENPPTSSDGYYLWYTGVRDDNPNSYRIGLAKSDDGEEWTRVTGAAEGGALMDWTTGSFDEYTAFAPWVEYEDGQYKMWYTGAAVNTTLFTYEYRIGYAVSSDGISWTKVSGSAPRNAVLDIGETGDFDSQRATHANIYKENGVYKMIYSGYDNTKYRLGFAVSEDGLVWTKHPGSGGGGSILDTGAAYDTVIAARGSMLRISNQTHIWYEGYTGVGNEYSIMYANTTGVMPPQLTGITIQADAATTLRAGDTLNFTATCAYSAVNPWCGGATCDCTNAVSWTSSDTAVAAITPTGGTLTATATGSTSITAECAGVTSNAVPVTVAADPVVLIISPEADEQVSGLVPVIGTVQAADLDQWVLSYGPGNNPNRWREIASGSNEIDSDVIAQWETWRKQGWYTLKLFASGTSGFTAEYTVTVKVKNYKDVTRTIPEAEWMLLSVPIAPDSGDPVSMFSDGTAEFKVYQWDPEATPQPYLDQYVYPEQLDAGSGYWINSYQGDLTYTYSGTLVDTTQDYVISLKEGWNQIGTPFDRDYPWESVRVRHGSAIYSLNQAALAGLISTTIYSYDTAAGSWVESDPGAELVQYAGYNVRVYEDVDLLFDPGAGLEGGMARVVRPVFDYTVNIAAQGEQSSDLSNRFGVSRDAQAEFDMFDAQEPPRAPGGDFTSLYFSGEAWSRNPGRYARDIRAPVPESAHTEEWPFVVETSETGAAITLSWDNTALPAEKYAFTLVNLDTGERVDMTRRGSYTYTAAAGGASENRFKIEVTLRELAEQMRTYTLSPGWSLISVPLDPLVTGALEQLGDDLPLLDVYQYYDGVFHVAGDADIQAGLGYWVHVHSAADIDITGLPVDTQLRVPLTQGWNLIGNPYESDLPWDDSITLICDGDAMTLSQAVAAAATPGNLYLFEDEQYAPAASMAPWKGYMLKMNQACDLLLAPPAD